ncbi:hypothetical protein T459_01229 [Capsicum annuum]|uniref:Uncharacterized protein n=1 Tax=Capsicum annuum TaxID=4072 RepID=A0A2G3AGJ4_CAPAN|nr:hypothetical protein T459_01229 [Capsicum annuum]
MIVPVIQVPSITPELLGNNTLAQKIKGELKDDVTGEKIHYLTESQIKLRKQGHYVATPKFDLGFKLPEPLRIATKKEKETTSSHYASVEKYKGSEDEKMPQQTFIFEHIGRLTPRVSVFERLGCKDKSRASKQMEEEADTSRTSIF